MGIYVYRYLYVYIRHTAHAHMLHLPADYPGIANTPFTLQPNPDEETNLQTVQDVLEKAEGSSWAVFVAGRAKHPATGNKASAQGIWPPSLLGKETGMDAGSSWRTRSSPSCSSLQKPPPDFLPVSDFHL